MGSSIREPSTCLPFCLFDLLASHRKEENFIALPYGKPYTVYLLLCFPAKVQRLPHRLPGPIIMKLRVHTKRLLPDYIWLVWLGMHTDLLNILKAGFL